MRPSLPRSLALAALSLAGVLSFGLGAALAEDIDIYAQRGYVASPSNVLFIIDNSGNFGSDTNMRCTYTEGGNDYPLLDKKIAGLHQCALVRALNSLELGSIKVGFMGFNDSVPGCKGNNGGCLLKEIKTLDQTYRDDVLIPWIKSWGLSNRDKDSVIVKSNSTMTAGAMQEAWAYFSGSADKALSTTSYAGRAPSLATSCGKNAIIYLANAISNNTGPGDTSGINWSDTLSGAGYSSPETNINDLTGSTSACKTAFSFDIKTAHGSNSGFWADEWTRSLYEKGIGGVRIATYTVGLLDINACKPDYPVLLQRMARVGGGEYFPTTDFSTLYEGISTALMLAQGFNTSVGSAALPVSSTNRGEYKNQVFVPMFRPDPAGTPRWVGNVKQFTVIESNGGVALGDSAGQPAVDAATGFITDCSVSYWTSNPTDASSVWYDYWANVKVTPAPSSACKTTAGHPWAESPDGPFVEKGGVAEVIRNGNDPTTTSGVPTMLVNRVLKTTFSSSNALVAFEPGTTGLISAFTGKNNPSTGETDQATAVINFIRGLDVNAEYLGPDKDGKTRTAALTPSPAYTRPSLHGDVLHGQVLAIDYGDKGVKLFYGSNDGIFRAVDGATGKELWGFVAPEHWSKLARLKLNSPPIQYAGMSSQTSSPRDYFFDGSVGLYQNGDNTKVWIYPSMRRGGRMIYAFDVTTPDNPTIKWKAGCDDKGCTAGMSAIGQTWSAPAVATRIQGYAKPVVVVGGGYDTCEDANSATPNCPNAKGTLVYVLDADTGAVVATLTPTVAQGDSVGSVAANVALIATDDGSVVNHAYVADTRGNIYRIDFGKRGDTTTSGWVINRVAYTKGGYRKFLYAPALLQAGTKRVYLALASGDREHPTRTQYPYTQAVTNRFYVYLDDLTSTTAVDLDGASMNNCTADNANCAAILPSSTQKGWYRDLNTGQGEQGVTATAIVGGKVAFSTNRTLPVNSLSCTASLGEARGYWLDLFTGKGGLAGGASSDVFLTGGLPPSPVAVPITVNNKQRSVIFGAMDPAKTPHNLQSIDSKNLVMKRNVQYWHASRDY